MDGCIAVCFVDLLRTSDFFTKDEAETYIETGSLNGMFVLGRSIGFIGEISTININLCSVVNVRYIFQFSHSRTFPGSETSEAGSVQTPLG